MNSRTPKSGMTTCTRGSGTPILRSEETRGSMESKSEGLRPVKQKEVKGGSVSFIELNKPTNQKDERAWRRLKLLHRKEVIDSSRKLGLHESL